MRFQTNARLTLTIASMLALVTTTVVGFQNCSGTMHAASAYGGPIQMSSDGSIVVPPANQGSTQQPDQTNNNGGGTTLPGGIQIPDLGNVDIGEIIKPLEDINADEVLAEFDKVILELEKIPSTLPSYVYLALKPYHLELLDKMKSSRGEIANAIRDFNNGTTPNVQLPSVDEAISVVNEIKAVVEGIPTFLLPADLLNLRNQLLSALNSDLSDLNSMRTKLQELIDKAKK